MINERMLALGTKRSTIRELFEFGKLLAAERGAENVFDYSLGNPSVCPPPEVNLGIMRLLQEYEPTALHGYTSAEGDMAVRASIAEYLKKTYGAAAEATDIYMTAGAAGALVSVLGALTNEKERVIALAPYFPEYKVFVERNGARLLPVACREGDFAPDIERLAAAIDETVAAIIVNSPNNPTGAVYSEADIIKLAELLTNKSREYGRPIYLIADEPYRELVYDGASVPFIPNYYDNTVVCYSFSKSLSIPGERIGYVFVSPKVTDAYRVFRAVCGAGRALGYVCAPSLLQRLVADCLGKSADIEIYDKNRKMLIDALTSYGYEVSPARGAFYLFVKSLCPSAVEFSEAAKEFGLLLVPSDDFGSEGYVRLAYCQTPEMIERSLPSFRALAEKYRKRG